VYLIQHMYPHLLSPIPYKELPVEEVKLGKRQSPNGYKEPERANHMVPEVYELTWYALNSHARFFQQEGTLAAIQSDKQSTHPSQDNRKPPSVAGLEEWR
jgi:hypothetical protein